MSTHVLIGTTQGLVSIQGIKAEDHDVLSSVCINGNSTAAAISRDYYDFVKKGQGPIATDFNHAQWRLDISEDIHTGKSWQLAVYLAHYLQSIGQLGDGNPQAGDTVFWATGEVVTLDRSVAKVEHIEDKLAAAADPLRQWQQANIPVYSLLPAANIAALSEGWSARTDFADLENTVMPIEQLKDLEQLPNVKKIPKVKPVKPKTKSKASATAAFMLVGAAVVVVALWVALQKPLVTAPESTLLPEGKGLSLTVSHAKNGTCLNTQSHTLNPLAQRFAPTPLKDLCEITINTKTGIPLAVALDVAREIPVKNYFGQWRLTLPSKQGQDRSYAIVMLPQPLNRSQMQQWRTSIEQLAANTPLSELHISAATKQLGWQAKVYTHTLSATPNF